MIPEIGTIFESKWYYLVNYVYLKLWYYIEIGIKKFGSLEKGQNES